MNNSLPEEKIYRGFELRSFNDIPYTQFLNSQIPEEIMLAMLADFGKEKAEAIIKKIVTRLLQLKTEPIALEKYLRQLLVLARLRKNLVETLTEQLEDMAFTIDIESDKLYQRGMSKSIEKGREKGEYQKAIKTAKTCLLEGMSIEITVKITELSKEEVMQIAEALGK